MKRDCGVIESKIWLIGDSEPENNRKKLEHPFDLRHPTVHNIITSILDQIQDDLFSTGNRIDRSKLYIRNAVKCSGDWNNEAILNVEIKNFRNMITQHSPILIIPFGARAFEFVRRALNERSRGLSSWTVYKIGQEFVKACQNFNINQPNTIPLLHASICRGKFLEAHRDFCAAIKNGNGIAEENYFIATGKMISPILINNKISFNCWKMSC